MDSVVSIYLQRAFNEISYRFPDLKKMIVVHILI